MDYDPIAAAYDRRYELHGYPGIRAAILGVFQQVGGGRVLEVGCGTGRWLAELVRAGATDVAGIDPSREMLRRAARMVSADLRHGVAEDLPWESASFDVVLYINALHHTSAPRTALEQAFRVLRPGGTLLSIGLDPHEGRDRWYVYDFFPEALALDRRRFASRPLRVSWLEAAGFGDVAVGIAERLRSSPRPADARAAGLLERSFTSQLTAISDAEYTSGLRRLQVAADRDPEHRLEVDLSLYATEATRPS